MIHYVIEAFKAKPKEIFIVTFIAIIFTKFVLNVEFDLLLIILLASAIIAGETLCYHFYEKNKGLF